MAQFMIAIGYAVHKQVGAKHPWGNGIIREKIVMAGNNHAHIKALGQQSRLGRAEIAKCRVNHRNQQIRPMHCGGIREQVMPSGIPGEVNAGPSRYGDHIPDMRQVIGPQRNCKGRPHRKFARLNLPVRPHHLHAALGKTDRGELGQSLRRGEHWGLQAGFERRSERIGIAVVLMAVRQKNGIKPNQLLRIHGRWHPAFHIHADFLADARTGIAQIGIDGQNRPIRTLDDEAGLT